MSHAQLPSDVEISAFYALSPVSLAEQAVDAAANLTRAISLVWGFRLRVVLAEDRPPLTGYDQDLLLHLRQLARIRGAVSR